MQNDIQKILAQTEKLFADTAFTLAAFCAQNALTDIEASTSKTDFDTARMMWALFNDSL